MSITVTTMILGFFILSGPYGLTRSTMAQAQDIRVQRVIDGDTFEVHLRLIGVDTPETRHPRKPVEYYGEDASRFLKNLIQGKRVRIRFGRQRWDRYGRLQVYVFLADGRLVNAMLISEGYARASPYPPNLKYANLFRRLERTARTQRKGLWAGISMGRARSRSLNPPIIGNSKTRKFHVEGGRYYGLMKKSRFRVEFKTEREAIRRGYKKSKR